MRQRIISSTIGLLISGVVFCTGATSWAGVQVDLGGGPVRALKDGRVMLLLEIRSDVPLREVRIETSEQFPLSPSGARFDEKMRWQSIPVSPLVLRLTPALGSTPAQALNVGLIFHRRGGGDPAGVFTNEGRERRPSFFLVGVRADGKEDLVEVFLPFVTNVRVSHE